MHNRAKKLLSIFISIVMILSIVSGCAKKEKPAAALNNGIYMNRGQWIQDLANEFGIAQNQKAIPYYTDVKKDNPIFKYVQACYEWNILDKKQKKFNPGLPVTKDFAAVTAVSAVSLDVKTNRTFDDIKKTSDQGKAALAVQMGIAALNHNRFEPDKKLTENECRQMLTKAKEVLLSWENAPRDKAVLKKQVLDLRSEPDETIKIQDNRISMPEEKAKDLKEGSIMITPASEEYPGGLAKKVKSITSSNGTATIETVQPKLEEVYDEIGVAQRIIPKIEDIKPATEGVTAIREISKTEAMSFGGLEKPIAKNLFSVAKQSAAPVADKKGLSFEAEFNIKKGKLEFTPEWENSGLSVNAGKEPQEKEDKEKDEDPRVTLDKNGKLVIADKFKPGYEIIGKAKIYDFYIEPEVDMKPFLLGIEKTQIRTNINAEFSLSVKGKIDQTQIHVIKTKIPIGSTGLWVDVSLFLEVDINGVFSIKVEANNKTAVTYRSGAGFRQTFSSSLTTSAEIKLKLAASLGVKADFVALGIDLFDARAQIGLGARMSMTKDDKNQPTTCVDVEAYFPTSKISFGADTDCIAHKLNITATWNIMDISGALYKPLVVTRLHYEPGSGWVAKCTKKTEAASGSGPASSSATTGKGKTTAKQTTARTTGKTAGSTTADSDAVNVIGNSSGNLANGGIAAIQNGVIYYSGENGIYKMNQDGTNTKKIITVSKDAPDFSAADININVIGDWIYYTDCTSVYDSTSHDYKYNAALYKVNTNGKNKKKIIEKLEFDHNIFIIKDWIYYIIRDESGSGKTYYKIYKIKTDGTHKTNLVSINSTVNQISVTEDFIYYSVYGEGIYRMKTDGKENKRIVSIGSEVYTHSINIIGSWVYFIKDGDIYKVKKDGSKLSKIIDENQDIYGLNINEDWIYYSREEDSRRDDKIYKVPIDGSEKIKLADDIRYICSLNIAGDWIFFLAWSPEDSTEGDLSLYKMRVDGTDKILIYSYYSGMGR